MNDPLKAASLAQKDLDHLAMELGAGRLCFVQSLSSSAQAYLALALHHHFRTPLVWVVDSPKTLDLLHQDVIALTHGENRPVSCFPARETAPGLSTGGQPHPDLIGDRLNALHLCLNPEIQPILLTCIQALFQKTPSPESLKTFSVTLQLNQEYELETLAARLAGTGYSFEAEVQAKGQASMRGGLLDVWPPTEAWPLRLEFFGPVLDSIRTFDPAEQRSLERVNTLVLTPADERELDKPGAEPRLLTSDLLDYLPEHTLWAWSEPDSIAHHAEMVFSLDAAPDHQADVSNAFDRFRLRVENKFGGGQLVLGPDAVQTGIAWDIDLHPCEGLPGLSGDVIHPDLMDEARRRYVRELGLKAASGHSISLFFNTEGARDRFMETYKTETGTFDAFRLRVQPLSEGFQSFSLRFSVVAESDLYGLRKHLPGRYELHGRRPGPKRQPAGPRLVEWTDMQPGELVVHMDHGIGKYLGLYEIEFDGRQQEVLAIEYADKAKLYVPVSQTHLLSRYVGVGRRRPDLHALGGKRWTREKVAAEHAIRDLASVLLENQAARDSMEGYAFPADTPWQHEFEAAFPFQETPDQQQAIDDVKRDMESKRPTDRLICGDVGYGKTEVAMRAAFKAVMDGKQVAILVPTTILAQQHYDTFSERMAAYPVSIEMLSRFKTRAEQQDILRRLAEDRVDILIGTHRLLPKDVQFIDLGLVIIDEEQRFGVGHKEHLKQLRQLVDVLTMTATPIPRTLYMSLTGAKDMSTIQTPPQDRLPVETLVAQNTDELVREAILRELNRGGQVFYLHNRVTTIPGVYERLKKLVPEARIDFGHGQMHEDELAGVMHRFVRGEFDVLLCTTIIESGVDIPNVNTILIDRADRFGMAELYQLRGRVGRYKHQAYAYLLLPRHGRLFDNARKRIGAIKRYSSLGAGFKLALRDLEIRGAGNLLGAEQSGHISAVGFDLYCQLLKRTVIQLKGEAPPPIVDVALQLDFVDLSTMPLLEIRSAVIPSAYIEDENHRVNMYRKIASSVLETEIDGLYEEFRDRFGPIPDPLDRLLKIARLRIRAAAKNIQSIEVAGDKVMIMRNNDYLMKNGRHPRLKSSQAGGRLNELLRLADDW